MPPLAASIFFHAIGATAAACCYVPQKKVKGWSWQSYWLTQAAFCWLLLPIVGAFLTVPDFWQVVQAAPREAMLRSFLLGAAYGIGGTAFGVAIRYVGFSVTYAAAIGISTVMGTAYAIAKGNTTLADAGANIQAFLARTGANWVVVGIADRRGGRGVLRRGRAMEGARPGAGRRHGSEQPQPAHRPGALFVLAGVLSAVYGISLTEGAPIAKLAESRAAGHTVLGIDAATFCSNAIYPFSNSGAFLTTALYCLYLHARHRTLGEIVALPEGEEKASLPVNWTMADPDRRPVVRAVLLLRLRPFLHHEGGRVRADLLGHSHDSADSARHAHRRGVQGMERLPAAHPRGAGAGHCPADRRQTPARLRQLPGNARSTMNSQSISHSSTGVAPCGMAGVQSDTFEYADAPWSRPLALQQTLNSPLRFAAAVLLLTSLLKGHAAPQETQPADAIKPQPDAGLQLDASAATIHGQTARFMVLEGLGNICYWTDPADWVSWETALDRAGEFVVEMKFSCAAGSQGSTFEVTLGDENISSRIAADTGTWYDHEIMKLGSLKVPQTGRQTLALKPTRKPGQAVMNLAWLRLIPVGQYPDYLAKTAAEHQTGVTNLARAVFVVPNFHPASCGWLTDWSTERNYCAYSYLTHLDRVRDDRNYAFALSEVNNMMAILEFEPQRFEELKQRVHEGRVELCNAFFLEPTINLSGGEALVKMGVEGLRWQQRVMGARPRVYWGIDVTGVHEQMAQIVAGLGLDAFVFCRDNPTGSSLHWQESPDGTRALALSPGEYAEFGALFATKDPLRPAQLRELAANLRNKARRTPAPAPLLVLGGWGDYSVAPARKEYPAEFLQQWKAFAPTAELQFSGPGRYLDAVLPLIKSGQLQLPVSRSGAHLTWSSFWIQCPTVKRRYRESEQELQAAEAVSAIASVRSTFAYPVQPLYDAWLLMCLNMDRNTLWGAAGGMVFEHATSWDARDRFDKVESISANYSTNALRSLLGEGPAMGLFNPLNWRRHDPVRVRFPPEASPAGATCQAEADGLTLCEFDLPPLSATGAGIATRSPEPPVQIDLPPAIETKHYTAKLDPASGALVSLKLKPTGREILGGPILLVAEQGGDGHNTPRRAQRQRLADSARFKPAIQVSRGPLATVVEARSKFHGGGELRQTLHFYAHSPRIDFDVECEGIPNKTVVVAEFPLAREIKGTRRGIPYGFSHGAWSVPNPHLSGFTDGILAAIRWSHYEFVDGGGVALLDRGLPGRELTGRTPVLFLLNAQDTYMGYRCAWLSGKGKQHGSFALVAHDGDWPDARIPQMAWEFNCPPILAPGVKAAPPASFAETSDNVIVEAVRREGGFIEMRLAECLGRPGKASVTLSLPHGQAALTDLVGQHATPLAGGPTYEFPVRPQQIVTLRFETAHPVAEIQPLLKWDELVPEVKLPTVKKRLPGRVGHPPQGTEG